MDRNTIVSLVVTIIAGLILLFVANWFLTFLVKNIIYIALGVAVIFFLVLWQNRD